MANVMTVTMLYYLGLIVHRIGVTGSNGLGFMVCPKGKCHPL